jgi:single-stranded-DNA-specific exonuclease
MSKKYLIRKKIPDDRKVYSEYSGLIAHLLQNRNIVLSEEIEAFMNPDYAKHTHDPFLMKDMEEASLRIIKAIENNERIAIYSDYDADGIPAGVIFYDLFMKIGYMNFINYIPDRHGEGFGLNINAIKELARDEVKLIITLDCGITDVAEADLIKDLGMDLIITDHHEPHAILPTARAVIDPKRQDCTYPDKNLCGAGVGFKLIQAILAKNRFDIAEGWEKWLLDMVGIATLSDMVPLIGENRVFASYGLKVLRKSPRKGLLRLLEKIGLTKEKINEDDIGFSITPRINAASRMGVARDAFRLFTTNDNEEATLLANRLDRINSERKSAVAVMVKEAKKNYLERKMEDNKPIVVMGNPNWRPSLVGLVANSLAEQFDRSFFVWGRDNDGEIKGSCRGSNTSLISIMQAVPSGVFIKYGGHKASGGFTVAKDFIHGLENILNDHYKKIKGNKKEESCSQAIDAILDIDTIDHKLFDSINSMSPFGTGNEKPVFLFKDCYIENIKTFGKEKNHMEIILSGLMGNKYKAISFFSTPDSFSIKPVKGDRANIVGSIEKNTFVNKTELRVKIQDIIGSDDYDIMVS